MIDESGKTEVAGQLFRTRDWHGSRKLTLKQRVLQEQGYLVAGGLKALSETREFLRIRGWQENPG